jgi:hypothetical protein
LPDGSLKKAAAGALGNSPPLFADAFGARASQRDLRFGNEYVPHG